VRARIVVTIIGAAALFAAVGACSSDVTVDSANRLPFDVGPACIDDPFGCATGTTCWIDSRASSYRCAPEGSAKVGEACHNVAGSPTCAAGLTCYSVEGYDPVCTPLCDDAHACAGDAPCQLVEIEGTTERIRACRPDASTLGGGGAGGASEGT
jgi:hypothetical protein